MTQLLYKIEDLCFDCPTIPKSRNVSRIFFSHAGVTNAWYSDFLRLPILNEIRDKKDTLADLFNKVDQTGQRYLLHAAGYARGGYDNDGIIWADKKETMTDMLKGYHLVVGHTVVPQLESIQYTDRSVTYIDVLDKITYFHELDIP
ncbi:hypothetical protein [Pedobacter hiemivivus]|uniref:Uncharacterized protein n=1 Tax=Pedobacter hiemivivus TaxID=2530454 RepID=A0A4R0ND37_9SPHI|nr:hypothetical protein [Pedobacter hiemivivus]TCC96982.1 hypothetical protein EZ444_08975 [Pedobacter hiemivivus]